MYAAFATLAFLVALWLAFGAALMTLAGGRNRIIAALNGRSSLAVEPRRAAMMTARISQPARMQRPLRAQPEWRAAA